MTTLQSKNNISEIIVGVIIVFVGYPLKKCIRFN